MTAMSWLTVRDNLRTIEREYLAAAAERNVTAELRERYLAASDLYLRLRNEQRAA